jgi:Family of unknown function (DUF6334)
MIAASRLSNDADPMLLPNREAPYVLQDVFEKFVDGCRDELILDLGDCFHRFRVDIDTDEIGGEFHAAPFLAKKGFRSIRGTAPWKKYIKKECGWTWLARNQQGYLDTILLSFDVVIPNLLLYGLASSIEVFVIKRLPNKIAAKKAKTGQTSTKRKR